MMVMLQLYRMCSWYINESMHDVIRFTHDRQNNDACMAYLHAHVHAASLEAEGMTPHDRACMLKLYHTLRNLAHAQTMDAHMAAFLNIYLSMSS